jgi:hypothetical protein
MLGYFAYRVKRARQLFFDQPPPPLPAVLALRCREITPSDLEGVIDLLTVGFRRRPRDFWVNVVDRLTHHHTPAGFPKYGFMLENDGVPIGVLLLIFTQRTIDGVATIWCDESSYYVDPRFRPYGSIMVKRSHRYKNVTYLNLTTGSLRSLTMEVQGYKRLAQGVYVAVPALSRTHYEVRVYPMATTFSERLETFDFELLINHASYGGCISLICEHEGRLHPFVFAIRRKYGLRFAYLIYSKNQNEFVKFAAPIGRYLAKRGIPLAALDADGPLYGIPGTMTRLRLKFWNGPVRPRLGDLAYTEIPMFGVI